MTVSVPGEQARQVAELEKKYNQAKNEQTIRELAQQKQIYLLFAVAGLLVAVVIGFLPSAAGLITAKKS